MIYINEWLANPIGKDAGEWIEVYNSGDRAVSLDGWYIETGKGSQLFLSGDVPGGGYRVFTKHAGGFVLRNRAENISLFDSFGHLISTSSYAGTFFEGKSFARQENGRFLFTEPTPGRVNNARNAVEFMTSSIPYAQNLTDRPFLDVALTGIGMGVMAVVFVLLFVKKNENLSKHFFAKN